MRPYVTELARAETEIKILPGVTVFCQRSGCERGATHLFRSGKASITAYCELHAEVEAERIGVDLSMDKDRFHSSSNLNKVAKYPSPLIGGLRD
jgi:hypothetical protein